MINLRELYRFDAIYNDNREIVIDLLAEILERDNTICHCEQCILDIVAITLNELQPRYRVGLLGAIDSNGWTEKELREKITSTLHYAVMRVTENPHHSVVFVKKK